MITSVRFQAIEDIGRLSDGARMNGLTFTNKTGGSLTLIIEPIAEEYALHAGDKVELRLPLFLDKREVIDVELTGDMVIVYAAIDVEVIRNGKRTQPENSRG